MELRQVCGGYAYFSTYSHYIKGVDERFERRQPSEVDVAKFSQAMRELGQDLGLVDSEASYGRWLYLQGWAVLESAFAQRHMATWLRSRRCLKSALGSFTDVEIASPKTLMRSYRGKAKRQVLARDGNACRVCGSELNLTLQHIWPFSAGGETASRNMITLCANCNQAYADQIAPDLYRLAGLAYSHEPSLLKGAADKSTAFRRAVQVSNNLMHTRCEVW
ncbi:hypothetical protein EGK76_14820 [Luteimonas sp. 100069]|nr:hypothetical protein EGK76_14820 [Luteimonas sp. 100069]